MTRRNTDPYWLWSKEEQERFDKDIKIEWSTYDAGLGHQDGSGILEPWEVW